MRVENKRNCFRLTFVENIFFLFSGLLQVLQVKKFEGKREEKLL